MRETKFKQTEIGEIPEDWDVKPLGELYNITSSKRVFQSEWRDKGVPFYRAREIAVMGDNKPAPIDLFITEEMYEAYTRQYGSISENDILITGVGTLGKVYVVKATDRFYFKDGNIIWLQWSNNSCSQFVKHLYDTPILKKQVFGNAGGSTVSTYTITNAKNTIIPYPDIKEQERIAEALSDMDGLLRELDGVIAKKRAIKQGAMQELLTGKRRLEGFEGEWVTKTISEIGWLTGAGVDKKTYRNEKPVRLVNYLDVFHRDFIYQSELDFWVTASKRKIEQCNVLKGDVFFTPSSEMPYDIALSAVAMEDMKDVCYSYHIYRLRFKEDIDLLFRTYMFKSNGFYDQANLTCEGSGKRYVISLKKFREMTVFYPLDKLEQEAIGKILSDMDEEIAALEAKRAKYEQVKQGMMQELLTGRVRLNY